MTEKAYILGRWYDIETTFTSEMKYEARAIGWPWVGRGRSRDAAIAALRLNAYPMRDPHRAPPRQPR